MQTNAVVIREAGAVHWQPVDIATPQPNEALVRITFGGLCGSDLHYLRDGRVGESIMREPLIVGHEVTGIIEQQATDGSGPAAGTQVFIHPADACGNCVHCTEGAPNLCESFRYLGSAAVFPHSQGGFRERMVMPTNRLLDASGIPARDAALIEPAAVAWHALGRVQALGRNLEGPITVVGCGPIGLLTIAAIRAQGSRAHITAVDIHDAPLQRALALGANATRLNDPDSAVVDVAPESPVLIFETSGVSAGLDFAVRSARRGGLVVAVGQLPPESTAPVQLVVGRELVISGSSRFSNEAPAVIEALRSRTLKVDGIVSHELPVTDLHEAFRIAADASTSGKVLLSFHQ